MNQKTKTRCFGLTKLGKRCKNQENCHIHTGKGLYSEIKKRVKAVFTGPRKGPTKRFTDVLNGTSDQSIKSIRVVRKPIISGVKTALQIMSFGKFGKKEKDLKYDDVYHNYMIVELDNGSCYKIEKNHVIEAVKASKSDYDHESYNIPLKNKISMKSLIDNAADKSGNSQRFYQYNGRSDNCQRFVETVINQNHLQPDDLKARELIQPQRADLLIDSLGALSSVPKSITDVAAHADHIFYGEGIEFMNKRRK